MKYAFTYALGLLLLAGYAQGQSKDYGFAKLPDPKAGEAVANFAGGCFWAMEEGMNQLAGVHAVVSGYAGGDVKNPTYEQVSTDRTGHAESVQVYYDPKIVSYDQLLEAFLRVTTPPR